MKKKSSSAGQKRLALAVTKQVAGGFDLPASTDQATNVMRPSASLLCKLGSIAVHVKEFLSSDGHEFDRAALQTLLDDPETKDWLHEMDQLAFLPKMRRPQS